MEAQRQSTSAVVWARLLPTGIVLALTTSTVSCTPAPGAGSPSVQNDVPVLTLPVEGAWRVVRSPGHDEFAYDLAAVEDAGSRTLARSRLRHSLLGVDVAASFGWGRPVRAPVAGEVAAASDGWPDRERLHLLRDLAGMALSPPRLDADDIRPFAGNYVILRAEGYYVFLAHLRRGSVRVTEGDRVEAGDLIGRVGNSGLTLEPHLHLQLFDQIEDLEAAGTPGFVIERFERRIGERWTEVRAEPLRKGETIRNGGESEIE